MAVLPDLQALAAAAVAVERTAADVDADAAAVKALVDAVPWSGPRRERLLVLADGAIAAGRRQAQAERDLALALRQMAAAVQHELEVLAVLASQARRHLEELLSSARGLAVQAAQEAADILRGFVTIAVGVMTGDPGAAVQAAQALAEKADSLLRSITARLANLPAPHDPAWRHLGEEILRWQPL